MNSKDVGERITTLRKQKGYTQATLAERLNVSNKTVSRWETGDGFPEISILPNLAQELDTTVDLLLQEGQVECKKNRDERSGGISNILRFFEVCLIYEGLCLSISLILTLLSTNLQPAEESVVRMLSITKVGLFVFMVIIGSNICRKYEEPWHPGGKFLLKVWLAAFIVSEFYQACVRIAWIATTNNNAHGNATDQQGNLLLIIFGIETSRILLLCVCGFVTKEILKIESAGICYWILCIIGVASICIYLIMIVTAQGSWLGKFFDIYVYAICAAYIGSIVLILKRKRDEERN